LWSVLVSCEGTAWFLRARGRWIHRSGDNRGEETQFLADRPVAVSPVARSAPALQLEDTTPSGDGDSGETLPDGVSQRITRASNEQGAEMIYGIVRCDFAPHQRQQNIHIAFCPPLDSAPQLTVDQVDGPTAGIRTTVVETYGAAIEVKLKAARSDLTSVQIQFYACESPASEATV
jgi:hypothetical protein